MISASEPLEFVPHGRKVIEIHPAKAPVQSPNQTLSEPSLLHKLSSADIEDESFIANKNSLNAESWCVQEAYYRDDVANEEEPSQPAKESKDSSRGSSTSRHFTRLDKVNVSLKSDSLGRKCEAGSSRGGSANSSSNMSKKFGLNPSLNNDIKKKSALNLKTDCWYEEELYVKGCTAVWSKGYFSKPDDETGVKEHRDVIASYTVKSRIQHAIFCNFHLSLNNVMFIDALNTQIQGSKNYIKIEDTVEASQSKIIPSILLIDQKTLTVYAKSGREFVARVPFQVKKVWPMKYGVLLEKEPAKLLQSTISRMTFTRPNVSCNSSFRSKTFNTTRSRHSMSASEPDVLLPTCFSLSHPLDEVLPCLMKTTQHGCQYYNNGDLQIIFVSSNPSIILLYDWHLGVHTLWFLRKATREESLKMVPNINFTTPGPSAQSYELGIMMGSKIKNTTSGSSKKTAASRYATNISGKVEARTPQSSMRQNTSSSILATPPVATMPLYPEVCFDHIWTQDTQSLRRDPIESASDTKAFVHTDFVGHSFLCFIVRCNGVSRLLMARLQRSHSTAQSLKSNIIVGSVTTIIAKDAVVLNHLHLLALIDDTGNIILHSGTSIVGKVHIGGVLACLIDSPYTRPKRFHKSFPRRSSLLPTKNIDVSMADDPSLHVLSPVPHSKPAESGFLGIKGLCDPIYNRLTLIYDKGMMYRITLPELTTSGLVKRCITALKAVLPRDLAMQVIVNWYGTRNAPGSQQITSDQDWQSFVNLLYTLLGYNLDKITNKPQDPAIFAEVATKRQRRSSDGSNDDWEYLLNSKVHKSFVNSLSNTLNLTKTALPEPKQTRRPNNRIRTSLEDKSGHFNSKALLFQYSLQVLYALHLVYEELKLSLVSMSDLQPLSVFLFHLAKEMRKDGYTALYWHDFPTIHLFEYDYKDLQVSHSVFSKLPKLPYFKDVPPQIFLYLQSILLDLDIGHYPYLANVNNRCKDMIEILNTVQRNRAAGVQPLNVKEHVGASSTPRTRFSNSPRTLETPECKAIKLMHERGINQDDIDDLPPAIALFIHWICRNARVDPPLVWPPECFNLIGRPELAIQTKIAPPEVRHFKPRAANEIGKDNIYTLRTDLHSNIMFPRSDDDDVLVKMAMHHMDTKLLRLLYPEDLRALEAFKLLQSSLPVDVGKLQGSDVSDHDFIEEQEKHLFCISTRTTALPVGRGMLTLRTFQCLPTEPLSVPKLNVSGRGPPPRSLNLELNVGSGDASPNYLSWPSFHNGVAAGLSLVPAMSKNIDFSWVMFNRPKGTGDTTEEHAGFLMALGLNGYLKDMPYVEMYDYFVKAQEMVSAAILIGLSATYRGTMNCQALKLLSIHLEPLLPPTSIELNIPQITVAAALLGLGLVFEGSGHTHFTHVMLEEIGKPPSSETQNNVDREGYALAAGLSLGFICIGKGAELSHHIVSTLRTFMLGAKKNPLMLRDRGRSSNMSLDVTSPGATVALGLIYLRSGNKAVAQWMDPPNTGYMIDAVRPDHMMLRVIARGLIMWDDIKPDKNWVDNQVPPVIMDHCLVKPSQPHIDYNAINQSYCNIVAGACFSIGLRFAGSANKDAKDVLLHYVQSFISISRRNIGVLVGRATLETCICVALVASGMVMAGTGDLDVLRWCRFLRTRVPTKPRQPLKLTLTYGGQMAVHTALGLLFLGGGRFTLSTSPTGVAAMLTAFFPKFPIHTEDNRYHLQAFRHLYVLAVEMRLVIPRDIDRGALCYANLNVITLDGDTINMRAPCMVPPLETLKEIRVSDHRYWPQVFQRDNNWDQLKTILDNDMCIDIKHRADFPTYDEDEDGQVNIIGQSLIRKKGNVWAFDAKNLHLYTNDMKIKAFIRRYLVRPRPAYHRFTQCEDCFVNDKNQRSAKWLSSRTCRCRRTCWDDREFLNRLNVATYFCIIKDSWHAIITWMSFLEILRLLKTNPSSYNIWQIKLLNAKIDSHYVRLTEEMSPDDDHSDFSDVRELLLPPEFALAFNQKIVNIFEAHEKPIAPLFRRYLGLMTSRRVNNCTTFLKKLLSAYSTFYDAPKYLFANRLIAIGKEESLIDDYLVRLNLTPLTETKVAPVL